MTKEAEMLALADEFDGEAKANRALGDAEEARKCFLAAKALRAAASPAPAAGVIDREAVAKIIDPNAFRGAYVSTISTMPKDKALAKADAILALKPTMAGEPVAWRWRYETSQQWHLETCPPNPPRGLPPVNIVVEPLYASPAPSGRDPATIEAAAHIISAKIAYIDKIQGWQTNPVVHDEMGAVLTFLKATEASIRALAAPALVTDERVPTLGESQNEQRRRDGRA